MYEYDAYIHDLLELKQLTAFPYFLSLYDLHQFCPFLIHTVLQTLLPRTMPHPTVSLEIETLLGKCIGQRVKIPYLFNLCPTWFPNLNKHDEQVRNEARNWRNQSVISFFRFSSPPFSKRKTRLIGPKKMDQVWHKQTKKRKGWRNSFCSRHYPRCRLGWITGLC